MTTVSAEHAQSSKSISPLKWRVSMVVLLLVYTLNFLDRQIVNILAESIKQDLDLQDWQLGLLTGFAFAVFYALAGIPIARYAERGNRKNIIGAAVAIWSGFTVLCGFAGSFIQLLICRFGVGIGEAGGVPPGHSLITDISPKEKRASAMAFFHLGLPLGTLLGLAMGGLIADQFGWRVAFIVAGLPGLLVAFLAFFVLPEPRNNAPKAKVETVYKHGFRDAFLHLVKKPSFVFSVIGATSVSFVLYAHQAFVPAFYFRVYGVELVELASTFGLKPGGFLGITLGLMNGVAGAFGLWLGGKLADLGAKKNLRYYCTVPAIATVLFIPVQALVFLVPSLKLSLLLCAPSLLLMSMWIAPFFTTLQSVAPPDMRATGSALGLLSINLIGLGLGPLVLGVLSDVLSASLGLEPAEGLRWALVTITCFAFISVLVFFLARKTIEADVEG